ncbi:SCAN domain-containing protein 3-like, partial [Bombyx mandarina]|uniref:SCAN domain-containing protein 3-like n=1 Tax=Bombyx mandarina TaxID=7092 RepID=A0A6J2KMA0_BOMMA
MSDSVIEFLETKDTELRNKLITSKHDIAYITYLLLILSNVNTAISPQLEEELTELTTNEEIKIKFKNGYQECWLQNPIPQSYPGFLSIVQRFLTAFPSSYLCEGGFSAVATLLTKKGNVCMQRGDLWLFL